MFCFYSNLDVELVEPNRTEQNEPAAGGSVARCSRISDLNTLPGIFLVPANVYEKCCESVALYYKGQKVNSEQGWHLCLSFQSGSMNGFPVRDVSVVFNGFSPTQKCSS